MLKKASINITLSIQGPILCKAIASSSWGIDATFDRNYKGIPYIDRSHIKGKLKEALKELGANTDDINNWKKLSITNWKITDNSNQIELYISPSFVLNQIGENGVIIFDEISVS